MVQRDAGQTVPEKPAAESIIKRHAFFKHKHAACAACSHAARGCTLCCGIGGEAAAATEKCEAGNLAQRVIECERRAVVQLPGVEHNDIGCCLLDFGGGTLAGNDNGVSYCGRLQCDGERHG